MIQRNKNSLLLIPFVILLASCGNTDKSDAYGNFEATTVTVSAKGNGELSEFSIQEGVTYNKGEIVGLIDTTHLQLEKLQIDAQLQAISEKTRDAGPDAKVLEERKINLIREKNRTEALLKDDAATKKQLDDLEGEIQLVDQQVQSLKRNTEKYNKGILAEIAPLKAQRNIIQNRINDQIIWNPISGTVLTKMVEPYEYVGIGKPLYKIANLSEMKLKAYSTAELLQKVKLNDEVIVLIDDKNEVEKELIGRISWISSEAEFTPENIQTREERVGLVYALDVVVKNDGTLKIGLPAEVIFNRSKN